MPTTKLPAKVNAINEAIHWVGPLFATLERWQAKAGPNPCDFMTGNPQEMPVDGYVDALGKHMQPKDKDWFAYKMSEDSATDVVANHLQERFQRPYTPGDIKMTNGATGGLQIVLQTVAGAGDEVIFLSPPWFFYESYIVSTGATPVRANINWETFDIDLAAVEAAITERTKLIIINSPNNPTGKIYSPKTLTALAELLNKASERIGHRIFLLSDEAYREILLSGNSFTSPTSYYPDSFMVYTYGKKLLTPGQRLGYVAVSPEMADREMFNGLLQASQIIYGYAFPNAILQHGLEDIQTLSIDVDKITQRADYMIGHLREQGYEVHRPEGTFYLLPKSPIADADAFCELLAEEDIWCLPGPVAEADGYFRISLTASDDMVERSIPGFRRAIERATA